MQGNADSIQLLRQSLTRHLRELAGELLYWTQELNKLETSPATPREVSATVIPFGNRTATLAETADPRDAGKDPAH